MNNISHYIPTKILFGQGKLCEFHAQRMPGKRALIVISEGRSVEKYGYLDRLTNEMQIAGVAYEIFSRISKNPDCDQIMDGARAAREYACDFVIGFGGGSCMDAAKAIAVLAVNDGHIWEYMSCATGSGRRTTQKPLPVIEIPTNAGSGSAVDPWATVRNRETNEKAGYGYSETFPVLAIVDPLIMCTVPRNYTIYQGFDIFCHCMECYIAKRANPMSDMYALYGLEQWKMGFLKAVKDGSDVEAREHMAFADICAGMAMCNCPVTSLHNIGHLISARYPQLPHGAELLMLLKPWLSCMERQAELRERFQILAVKIARGDEEKSLLEVVCAYMEICGVDRLKMEQFIQGTINMEMYRKEICDRKNELFWNDRVDSDFIDRIVETDKMVL